MSDELNAYEAPKHASQIPSDAPKKKSRFTWVELLVVVAIIGLLVALLFPAMRFVPRAAIHRMQCGNNLKQIALALHNYHDEHNTFPPAYIADEDGKPMHSWRVLILPFVEQQQLYDQYNFYEPWDGPNNRKLIGKAPEVFRCPGYPEDDDDTDVTMESLTQYFVVSGAHTAFPGATATALRDIADGTENSLLLVDSHLRHVAWTAPIDISVDELVQSLILQDPMSSHQGGFQVALADRTVRFIPGTVDPKTIRLLSTIDDGEPISEY